MPRRSHPGPRKPLPRAPSSAVAGASAPVAVLPAPGDRAAGPVPPAPMLQSCAHCVHAFTGALNRPNGYRRQLVDCEMDRWTMPVSPRTFYNDTATFKQRAANCPYFQADHS